MTKQTEKTILLIEDNPLNMKLFVDILECSGYRVIRAESYMDALLYIVNFDIYRFDTIITDICLGEFSGLDIVKIVRTNYVWGVNIPIIAITAFAMKGDRLKCLEAGCNEYLSKPVRINDFLETIGKYCTV